MKKFLVKVIYDNVITVKVLLYLKNSNHPDYYIIVSGQYITNSLHQAKVFNF